MWPWLGRLLVLLGLVLTACNGSGSSGFDGPNQDSLSPTRSAENTAIAEVLDASVCIPQGMLLLCPTNTAVLPTGEEVLTPTVATMVPLQITCQPQRADLPCHFPLSLLLQGFTPPRAFQIAARPVMSNATWLLADNARLFGMPAAARLDAEIQILQPPEFAAGDFDFQLAVLVLPDSTVAVPEQFELLEDSGADLAFVSTLQAARSFVAR